MTSAPAPMGLAHRLTPMRGRDPHEPNRTATSLELFFDLTFVIAFSQAGNEFAHLIAEGHYSAGVYGFGFAMFAICWAWINFTWFASAFDTDDWAFRVVTMVQMVGVLILAMGLPEVFESIDKGEHLDNGVVVLGYVVMRVAMIFQWLRAARQDEATRRTCLAYATSIAIAQVGWIALLFAHTTLRVTVACALVLYVVEMAGPMVAERKGPTPWHPHHIAERYALLAIIALGECLLGTIASLSAAVHAQGWSVDAALVGLGGTGLAFGMWWMYFMLPSADLLHLRRGRSWVWGYGHILVFAAIAATGAGLHVAAYYIEHVADIGATAVVASVTIPVGVFALSLYGLYNLLMGFDPFHVWLLAGTAMTLIASVALAAAGVSVPLCLLVVMLAPVVSIVGDELVGVRHRVETLDGFRARVPQD